MKIVNDRSHEAARADHCIDGYTYRYQSHLYMKVRLKCVGLSDIRGKVALVNLKHGTTRLIDRDEYITPVPAYVICEESE